MAYAWPAIENKKLLIGLYAVQLILNVGWNPAFFYYHQVLLGLVLISMLTLLVGFILFYYWQELKLISLLIAPYLIWLIIATSLNGYILVRN